MQVTAFGTTDIGQLRERNEDALLIDEQIHLFVVCDGMGGHSAGDVASRKSAELVAEYLRGHKSALHEAHATPGGYFKLVELAEGATIHTSRRLHEMGSAHPECAGMGTTMTLLMIVDDKAVMSHVGDSRLYLLRDDEIHLLSSDHTMANELLQRGVLPPDEFDSSPFHHVLTRSVGSVEAVECDLLLFDVLPQDTFLLCSDGLSNYIEDAEELAGFLQREDLSTVPQELIELANCRGGKDNITAVVVRARAPHGTAASDDTRKKTEALQSFFLAEGISFSRLIRLVEISELSRFDPGATVLAANETCRGLYLIVDGRVQITHAEGVAELSSGQYFCETALMRKRKARGTVSALEPTTVLLLPRLSFQRLTRRFPKLGRILHTRLLKQFGQRIDEVTSSI